jgi:glycerophosphoryl diester phosphodiesterase
MSSVRADVFAQPDIQGHRGWRGLYPENTIPGFLAVAKAGIKTLELDVVVTKDSVVVASHEPWFSADFTTLPSGETLLPKEEKMHNIFKLSYEESKKYDVGLRVNPKFPEQKSMAAYKPALSEIFEIIEAEFPEKDITYNIEIKRVAAQDHEFHPDLKTYTDLVISVIESQGLRERCFIQSFDHEVLIYLKIKYPEYRCVMLVMDMQAAQHHLDILGFTPDVYSPYFILVNPGLVDFCREKGMKLIPWTVNDIPAAEKLLDLGVDGIISDYPIKILELVNR